MFYYAILMTIMAVYAWAISLMNVITMTVMNHRSHKQSRTPRVSVLIPARNEHDHIEDCVRSFMKQDYPDYEVLVLDDNSTDDTAAIVQRLEKEDSRVRLFHGEPLPAGWKGKNHAIQQLLTHAQGEYLLLTDADTIHNPNSIRLGVDLAITYHAKFVSGYPKEISSKPLVGCIIATMALNTMLFTPIPIQYVIQKRGYAMAIGQYVMVERNAMMDIGGMEQIKNEICDDVSLARLFVATGNKSLFCDLKSAVSCRMYDTVKGAFHGIERSVIGAIVPSAKMFYLIMIAVIGVGAICVAPFVGIAAWVITGSSHTLFLMISSLSFWAAFTLVTAFHGFKFPIPLMGPFCFTNIILMFFHGYYRRATGKGFIWKGRKID